MPHF
ncbi:hypothetical protein VTN00DRAFT_8609 [Thermoascus crustaceus]|jgi:hypothetical protein